MNKRTSFLTRGLALALALVLLLSNGTLGLAQTALAAATTVTEAQIVANSYDLTDAEKTLLNSGYLVSNTVTYDASDVEGLVKVDTDAAKITAANKENWEATSAVIVYGGKELTVELKDGEATYNPAVVGNAFSVKVIYTYKHSMDVAKQEALLAAGHDLKTGVNNLEIGYQGTDADLGTVVLALDTLKSLAEGLNLGFVTAQFTTPEAINAVYALAAEAEKNPMAGNNKQLDMQVANAAYKASASGTKYLVENGAAHNAALVKTYNYLLAIQKDELTNNPWVDAGLNSQDPAMATAWKAFKNNLNKMVTALEPIANTWNIPADALSSNVDYVVLDKMVADLGEASDVELKGTLDAASTVVQSNLAMYNVTVNVVLNAVNADNQVAKYDEKSIVLTLAENAKPADVEAEVAASKIVENALTQWANVYAEGKFDVVKSQLPASLNADTTYTITYTPKAYSVDLAGEKAEYPYGYQLTLPVHEDAAQSYDYKVNNVSHAQGEVITIVEDTVITRTAGKAYASTSLYTLVADLYGNDVAKAILKSGALKGNEAINYRKPDPADAGNLLKLEDGKLEAQSYDAAYNGLSWAPYTYGETGTENTFSGNTASWSGKDAKVQYILNLTNYSKAEVEEVLALAETLKAEADEQTKVLDTLAENYTTMGQLDKVKLGALNGVIDVTDFTPGDNTDADEKNMELRAYFKSVVSGIIANNLDKNNGYLNIYNMLGQYNVDGLRYYYNNSAAVIAEINSLSGYLDDLLEEEAALKIMVGAAGFPEYADKISDLQGQMAAVQAALTAPNTAIDLNSDKLGALVGVLEADGKVENKAADTLYMISETLTAVDQSSVIVQIIIDTPNGSATVTSESLDKGTVWTAAMNEKLLAAMNEEVGKLLGEDKAFYAQSVEGTLPVGQAVTAAVNVYYTYAEKQYTVKIDGEADQIVSLSDLEIDLPKHATAGWTYTYTVDGVATTASTYTFTKEQITNLFVNGTYTITRTARNEGQEKFEAVFGDWIVKDAAGNVVALNPEIAGNVSGLTDFAMTLVNSGYSYIGLNGQMLMGLNDVNSLELSLQVLVDAILADNTFGSKTLIALGEQGKGEVVHANIQLGNSADAVIYDLPFTLELTSVPAAMGTVANALKRASSYVTFQSNNGKMDVNVNLPDKAYAYYAGAMIATGRVDKSDAAKLDEAVAIAFICEYVDALLGGEMDLNTFVNTLGMAGLNAPNVDKYNDLFKALGFSYDENGETFTANVKVLLDEAQAMTGKDLSTYTGMIKEYKGNGMDIEIDTSVNLINNNTHYALIADVQAAGIINKVTAPSSVAALADKTSKLAGYSAVMMLADVKGDLTFAGTTILDLNGKKIDGSVTSTGTLYIIDSSKDTYNSGWITGAVSGKVSIFGGNYNVDVSANLKDGYYKDGTAVRNALYYITEQNGVVTLVLNADVYNDEHVDGYIPNARALAIDIAADLVLNYLSAASLSVEGNTLISIDAQDLLGLYAGENTASNALKQAISWVTIGEAGYENNVGFEALVNLILEDLLDFQAITDALNNGTALASYKVVTNPWNIELAHVAEGNYATINVTSNKNISKTETFALVIESKHAGKVSAMTEELAKIVVAEDTYAVVDIPTPTYSHKQFNIAANGKASMVMDMSGNNGYAVAVGVILANNGAAQSDKIVAAINASDWDALEAAINETTVQELISALKALARNTNFASMAAKVGVTQNLGDAAVLEGKFHLVLCGIGKAFEVAKINGMNVKLGNYLKDGYYTLDKNNISRDVEVGARGYSALITLTADEIDFKIKLFGDEPDCLWGDVNHDDIVDEKDATLILQYVVDVVPADTYFCDIRADVNADGAIDEKDATMILQYVVDIITKFPAEG